MKKYKVRLIKEDKEAYGGDLRRHAGAGTVRMSQTLKKGDIVQFQVADYRTNTRKYYKGTVESLKGERGYSRVVVDRANVLVTHEAEQTYRSSHDQQGTISEFVPVAKPYITEIPANELVAVNENMDEATERFKSEDGSVTIDVDIEAKASELAGLPPAAMEKIVSRAQQMAGAGNRKDINEMLNGLVIGDMVNILGSVLSGAKGEILEFTKTPQGKDAVVVKLTTDAPRKVYGQTGDEVLVKPDFLELDEPESKPEDDYNWPGHRMHYNRQDEAFRDSPKEKEMMKKMSNKEFYRYVTRDRHTVPNLKGDMGPLPGLEGPFQFQDGQVLYYDPKAGKYYDRGKDMYVENPPGNRKDIKETGAACGPAKIRVRIKKK